MVKTDPLTKTLVMWSGPRNLSTALMRSFGRRPDCQVWDEPFYAAYLAETGIIHPMRDEIIDDGISEPNDVITACLAPPTSPNTIFYQKHMTQHMLDAIDLTWIDDVVNAFLIRSPERVLASYAKKRAEVTAADLGYSKQKQLFDRICDRTGKVPVVIDSTDIRQSPERALRALCTEFEIPYVSQMLSWPAGPSSDDGIWGKHWYDAIWKSTGFAPPESNPAPLPVDLAHICDEVREDYESVAAHKIVI